MVKNDKLDISSLSSFSKWRYHHSQRGMGFDFEKLMVWVRTEVMEATRQQYSQYPYIISLAIIILTTTINFITQIISWVDDTYDLLVSGGKNIPMSGY